MPPRLPPELERVGDDLLAAVERALAARRRRRRLLVRSALTGVADIAAAAAFIPSTLGPSGATPTATPTAGAVLAVHLLAVPAACDLPLGRRLENMPACGGGARSDPVPLGRPGRW